MIRPANNQDPKIDANTPLNPHGSTRPSPVTESLRVLITDDNKTNRKLLRVLLEAENHLVFEADNGISALRLLEQNQVDAIISDILMPEMDGYRLCYEIRKNPKLRTLPFIVYTASYTSPSDEKVALQFGVDKFLRKPASSEEIVRSLHEVLASAKILARDDVQIPEEAEAMREYNQVLVRKLEDTIVDLSEANNILAERSTLAEFVATISTTLAEANGLREMLQRCCGAMVEHLGSAFARIWTLNEKKNLLELQASSGMYTHIDGGHARVPVGQFKIGLVASERKPHVTNAVIGDPRVHDQEWAKREGMVAFAGYPMLIGDQLVGVMATFARKPFSQNTLDAMGSVARSIAVGIRRQLSEKELRGSEERFRELAENIKEIFFVADPGGGPVQYVSPAYEEITGQRKDLLYQNPHAWLENIHPEDRPRIEQAFRDNFENLDQEYRIVRPDGDVRWLRSRAFPVKDESGDVVRVVGIAAEVTARKRAEERVNQNLNRIRALHEIDLAITSTLDLQTVVKVLLLKMEVFFPYPTVTTVKLLNRKTGELEALACHNIDLDEWKSSFKVAPGKRAGAVLDTKKPLILRNVLTDAGSANYSLYKNNGLVSYVGVPLVAKDEGLGVLSLYTREEHEFSEEEIEFLKTLAGQAAIAIHNAQLYAETARRRYEAEELARVARSLTETLDMQAVGDRIVSSIRELFGVRGATLRLLQPDGSFLRLASYGEVFSQGPAGNTVPPGMGLTSRAVTEGRPIWSPNVLNDPDIHLTEAMRDYQIRSGNHSMIAVPLRAHDKTIGALTLSDQTGRTYSDAEIALLKTFADQVALALENTRLFEEIGHSNTELEKTTQYLARSLKQLGGLYTALSPIAPAASTQEMVGGIIERLIDATSADAALIRVWDKKADRYPIISQRGFPDSYLKAVEAVPSGGAVDWVIKHGQPIIAPDIASESRFKGKIQLQSGLRSCAMLPLTVDDEVRGVMHIASRKLGYFDEEQRDHLLAIARQMSIALENRELFYDLKSSRDELERSNKVKDEFLSVMSHELRTPLNVIMGYTALLKEAMLGEINPKQMDATSKIMGQCMDLLVMVNSILQATQLGSAETKVFRSECSLSDLLDELKSSYAIPQAKELTISWAYPAMLPTVKTDEEKLKHILQNLINNAVKFTEKGQVVISARVIDGGMQEGENRKQATESSEQLPAVSDQQGGKRWLEFQVADTGVGIPKEQLPVIFDMFRQVDSSETRPYGGTGLGLYIVKKYLELLGGKVEVESDLGKGSIFTVVIPCEVEIDSFQATEATLH